MNDLHKTALVTGASRGIGKAICKELLQSGYSVIGLSRNIRNNDPHLNKIAHSKSVRYEVIQADVSESQEYDKIFEFIKSEFGKLNLLVHNAGVAPEERKDVLEMTLESYTKVMQVNLGGPIFLTQKLFPLLEHEKNGSVVFISSILFGSAVPRWCRASARKICFAGGFNGRSSSKNSLRFA